MKRLWVFIIILVFCGLGAGGVLAYFKFAKGDLFNAGSQPAIVDVESTSSIVETKPVAPSSNPSIRLLSPNGGEQLIAATSYNITWKGDNFPDGARVTIALEDSKDGRNDYLFTNIANDGQETWVTPDLLGNYRIRIFCTTPGTERYCSQDGTRNSDVEDYSDSVFTFIQPTIQVTYPNGGETLYAGKIYDVTWKSPDVNKVHLYICYTKEGLDECKLIMWTTEKGAYSEHFPLSIASDASYLRYSNFRIKIAGEESGAFDMSDAPFTIGAPAQPIVFVGPLLSGTVVRGTSFDIQWMPRSAGATILAVPYDGLHDPYVIVNNTGFPDTYTSTHVYSWKQVGSGADGMIPDGRYLLKICYYGTSSCATSDTQLTIASQ